MPLHTHENDGVIHMEFSGLVRKKDLKLGQFFKNWGKDMRSFGASIGGVMHAIDLFLGGYIIMTIDDAIYKTF